MIRSVIEKKSIYSEEAHLDSFFAAVQPAKKTVLRVALLVLNNYNII